MWMVAPSLAQLDDQHLVQTARSLPTTNPVRVGLDRLATKLPIEPACQGSWTARGAAPAVAGAASLTRRLNRKKESPSDQGPLRSRQAGRSLAPSLGLRAANSPTRIPEEPIS